MDAQTLLKANGAKASDLIESLGDTAQALAKTIEVAAVPLVAVVGDTASAFAKSVEEHAGPLAKSLEDSAGLLAKSLEDSAGLLAEAVGTTVEALTGNLEKKTEEVRDDVVAGVKSFKFGTREGIILGAAVGIFAAVWLIRKMDRQAAAERLRAAGARVGETTQELTSRVSGATQGLTEKASAVTGMASERVGQVVQQMRGQTNGTIEDAKLRLSDPTSPVREIEIPEPPKADKPESTKADKPEAPADQADTGEASTPEAQKAGAGENDLDKDTQAAIDQAVEEVERVQEEALEAARGLGLSNGMKVVAFDGTDIGRVQEVREDVFVLDRPKGADLLVPLTEIARIEGTVAYLRIEVGQVTKMGWEKADKS